MKILIYGAGILGKLYAYLLHKANIDVTLLARGQTLKNIQTKGIKLNFILQKVTVDFSPTLIEQLTPTADYDLIMVVMQKQQVQAILPIVAKVEAKPDIIILGNNGTALDDYKKLIDPQQIILGFPSAGGRRRDDLIDVVYSPKSAINLGEIDGTVSDRLLKWQNLFQTANIPMNIVSDIDAYLKYHIALVSPLANALYAVNCNNYTLARTPSLIDVGIDGIRESFAVLKSLNYPMLPKSLKFIYYPKWLLRWMVKKRMNTIFAEIAMAGHAKFAYAEMKQIANEFKTIAKQSPLKTPMCNFLYQFLNLDLPRVREGATKAQLNLDLYRN